VCAHTLVERRAEAPIIQQERPGGKSSVVMLVARARATVPLPVNQSSLLAGSFLDCFAKDCAAGDLAEAVASVAAAGLPGPPAPRQAPVNAEAFLQFLFFPNNF